MNEPVAAAGDCVGRLVEAGVRRLRVGLPYPATSIISVAIHPLGRSSKLDELTPV